jgi:exopolyphosphatase/guanosine-5'-triphosphate,3'-diphosphate pyrophosphatase
VGSFINRSGRHRHTHYLISGSELFGFTPDERQIIAAIARYLGKSRPDPADGPLKVLASQDQERVPRAVRSLAAIWLRTSLESQRPAGRVLARR